MMTKSEEIPICIGIPKELKLRADKARAAITAKMTNQIFQELFAIDDADTPIIEAGFGVVSSIYKFIKKSQ
ncbi:hypothetical protein [Bacillus sp. 3255]|uniref:hypothetical protein n=1 Tax=Bacillus sp. 3255 TaxID=2817904 RepID=UPI002856A728|nr:hypothetical protein [Bacillus sp. 3255]MDR6880109.1 hypothetical protein [Bacillus sp. 3255]